MYGLASLVHPMVSFATRGTRLRHVEMAQKLLMLFEECKSKTVSPSNAPKARHELVWKAFETSLIASKVLALLYPAFRTALRSLTQHGTQNASYSCAEGLRSFVALRGIVSRISERSRSIAVVIVKKE